MTSLGLLLTSGAVAMAVAGAVAYLGARRTAWRSRGMALALFSHGAFGTAGFLLLVSLIHFHTFTSVHVHALPESLVAAFACDLEWSCAATVAGVVAATVLGVSFLLSQVVARAMIGRALERGARPLSVAIEPCADVLLVRNPRPDAYSVAVLRRGGRFRLRFRDYVILTTGLVDLLSSDEFDAVIEHELAHIRSKDDRYLPFFHLLSSLVFFDPFVRYLRNRLSRRYEFDADEAAARATRRPRILAGALWKVWEATSGRPAGAAFLGRRRPCEILERIEHLLSLAESMENRVD